MWKVFILSSLLSVALAAQIEDFYGSWELVAHYPVGKNNATVCGHYIFENNPSNTQCTCANGVKLYQVQFSGEVKDGNEERKGKNLLPLIPIDTVDQIHQGADISCSCGKTEYTDSMVARSVNSKYFVMYEEFLQGSIPEPKLSSIMVFAKELPTLAELNETLNGIEELKGININSKCTSDK